jgi:hypothetical protein
MANGGHVVSSPMVGLGLQYSQLRDYLVNILNNLETREKFQLAMPRNLRFRLLCSLPPFLKLLYLALIAALFPLL